MQFFKCIYKKSFSRLKQQMSHERYYILKIYRESFLEQLTYFYRVLLPTSRLSDSRLSERNRSGVFPFLKLKISRNFEPQPGSCRFSQFPFTPDLFPSFFSFSLLGPLEHATRSSTKFKRKSVVLDAVENVVKEGCIFIVPRQPLLSIPKLQSR